MLLNIQLGIIAEVLVAHVFVGLPSITLRTKASRVARYAERQLAPQAPDYLA